MEAVAVSRMTKPIMVVACWLGGCLKNFLLLPHLDTCLAGEAGEEGGHGGALGLLGLLLSSRTSRLGG